jgi:protein-L-isoaspartate(D-aspartate) O-methyltransferase
MKASLIGMVVLAFVIRLVGCNEQTVSVQSAVEDGTPPAAEQYEALKPVIEEPAFAQPRLEGAEFTKDESQRESEEQPSKAAQPPLETVEQARMFAERRQRMVDVQMAERDIVDHRVLSVMRRVPRHKFVPNELHNLAYIDRPLPIGHEQTISQPYIVALMTQLARPNADDRALDIGTGSGYQAAVLAELVERVYSIEIVRPRAESGRARLSSLGYSNVQVICGDGYQGLPREAPFDVIIVAAAPEHIPKPLIEQLAPGGRLVIPVGRFFQNLLVIEKLSDGTVRQEKVAPVRFVPMTGEAEKKRD